MSDTSIDLVGKPTILLVDDEGLVRIMLAEDLQDRNYNVLEAASGDKAAALLRSGCAVDLVFTDVRMPGSIDGLALARLISDEFPQTKVILASGHIAAEQAGLADGFFSKPYDLVSVARKIETVLKLPCNPSLGSSMQPLEGRALESAE